MISASRKIQLALLTGLIGLSVACSNTADKGAIPPDGQPPKKVTNRTDEQEGFTPRVDVLFVVDDSGSMESHQANLSKNIKLFIQEIQKMTFLDYHIGVVTTSMDNADPNIPWDPSDPWSVEVPCDNNTVPRTRARACGDGKLVRYKTKTPYVDANTLNGLSILEDNLIVGTNGSGTEAMFDPVVAALTPPLENGTNAGFLRPDASLAIIFVTDAEDQSDNMKTGADFNKFLLDLKGGHQDKILAYGAIIPSNISRPSCPRDDYQTPKKLEEFLTLAKGIEFNLCDTDFGTKLAHIATDVVQKVGRIMYLSRPPVVDTIQVVYGSQVIPNDPNTGWTYDPVRNALIFGEKIVLSHQPPGTQMQVTFTAGQL